MMGKDHLGDQTHLEKSFYDRPQGNRGAKVRIGSEQILVVYSSKECTKSLF
jgi:hypothetical protein